MPPSTQLPKFTPQSRSEDAHENRVTLSSPALTRSGLHHSVRRQAAQIDGGGTQRQPERRPNGHMVSPTPSRSGPEPSRANLAEAAQGAAAAPKRQHAYHARENHQPMTLG